MKKTNILLAFLGLVAIAISLSFLGSPASGTNGTQFAYKQLPSTIPLYKKVTLDSAQIVNLFTHPDTVLNALGAGHIIYPVSVTITYHGFGATPYVTDSTDTGVLFALGDKIYPNVTANFDATVDYITDYSMNFVYADSLNAYNNKPLVLRLVSSATGNFTGGNGIANVDIEYLDRQF